MSDCVRKSQRHNTRINYKIFNETGVKMEKESNELQPALTVRDMNIKTASNKPSCVVDKEQQMKYQLLKEEIGDFIDENPANQSIVDIKDVEKCIDEITRLRSQFRAICLEIQHAETYDMDYSEEINSILASIKEYIINAKAELRNEEKVTNQAEITMKLQQNVEQTAQKARSADFLISEVTRLTDELHIEFCKETDGEVSDDEISRRKEDLPSTLLKMNQLSLKFQKCLETIPQEYENKEEIISNLKIIIIF